MRLLVAILALSGCAVVGEPGVGETDEPPIDGIARTPLAGEACANEDEPAAEVRKAIGRVRALAGLSPLRCDARATSAARGHCDYVLANHELTHVQRRGQRKFSGATAADRLRAASVADELAGEVIANTDGAGVILASYGFMNSVYHRAFFLRSETLSYGYAGSYGCATFDFGRRPGRAKEVMVVWPPTGSFNVPFAFYAARETPNPTVDGDVVGSPVSLIGLRPLSRLTATLTGPGGDVAVITVTHDSDPNGLVRVGEAHLIPRQPLEPSTQYHAAFTVDGERFETTFTTVAR